jgi:hypothetical protein
VPKPREKKQEMVSGCKWENVNGKIKMYKKGKIKMYSFS